MLFISMRLLRGLLIASRVRLRHVCHDLQARHKAMRSPCLLFFLANRYAEVSLSSMETQNTEQDIDCVPASFGETCSLGSSVSVFYACGRYLGSFWNLERRRTPPNITRILRLFEGTQMPTSSFSFLLGSFCFGIASLWA